MIFEFFFYESVQYHMCDNIKKGSSMISLVKSYILCWKVFLKKNVLNDVQYSCQEGSINPVFCRDF